MTDNNSKLKNTLQHWQIVTAYLVLYDAIAVTMSYFFALLLRFDFRFSMIPVISLATVITTAIHIIGITVTLTYLVRVTEYTFNRMPLSYYIIGPLIQFLLTVGIRFSYRFILLLRSTNNRTALKNSAVYGVGSAGQLLSRDIKRTRVMEERLIAIFDDNKNKWGRDIDGVPVVGFKTIITAT